MWIAVHAELLHHPKLSRLARNLGVPKAQALGHLTALWCWCAEYAEDGDLTAFDPEEISEGSMWEGDPATFVTALERAGFLDTDPDGGPRVHSWEEYSGRIRAAREAARERQARHRERDKGVTEALQVRDENVTERDSHAPGGDRRGLERIGVEGDRTEPPSASAAAACSPLSEEDLRSLSKTWGGLDPDQQGSWLASRADLPRLVATFQELDHEHLESLGVWQPAYLAAGLAKAEAAWKEATGRSLNHAERSFLADTVISALGDVDIVTAAIKETAVSTEKPNLKLAAAITARMADPNWEPVGAAKNVRVRPPEQKRNDRIDRRRPMTIDEIV